MLNLLIEEPTDIVNAGLLDICTEFAIVLDKTVRSVPKISEIYKIIISISRNELCEINYFDFRLNIQIEIINIQGEQAPFIIRARIFLEKDTDRALVISNCFGEEEFRGKIDSVIKNFITLIIMAIKDLLKVSPR